MGLLVVLKAGIVGGFGFVIAIGMVMALLIPVSQSLQESGIKVKKLPSIIAFLVVLTIELGLAYWYFSSVVEVTDPSDLEKFTMYACLFSLTPSIAIVAGAFTYYCDVQKAIQGND